MRGFVLLSVALLFGCSGPSLGLPGGSLGSETVATSWPQKTEDGILELETNPNDPYSVIIGFRAIEGGVYIDPAEERQWYEYLAADPRVRIRFDGEEAIYAAVAVPVEDEEILSQFEPDRRVTRLVQND